MEGRADLISGRYRVEATLGRGGMGEVYRVLDASTGESLALKRVTAAHSPKHVALFEREFHTLASLKHPNVIEVKDYGADSEGPYYTMELLQGSDLSAVGPLPWREVCSVLRDVAAALSLLHARRLVHRDVNPRNLWRTPDGDVKLLDFGALAPFGQVDHLVGTPPCVPPEALYTQRLDQRSDLYALGTAGYWLLTGRHAYPARALAQLKAYWQEPVRPPSAWVENLERDDLEPPPAALDALILALLGHDPMTRPASASEVIDRLGTIADLPPVRSVGTAEAHLASAAFAGRERELRVLMRALEGASRGEGGALVIVGERGAGRSRLHAELALRAGLRGATVVRASGSGDRGPIAVGLACARRLLDVAPDVARRAAAPHASALGHLSPGLREALGVPIGSLERMPHAPGEARMRLQEAMFQWFARVAEEVPLVLLVDDLHLVDEASLAWLAKMSRAAKGTRLLFVATTEARAAQESPAAKAIRRAARTVLLPALTESELREMLRSMFGDVPHLQRLADKVYQHSGGNPAHAMQLAEHLVRSQVVRFADAGWLLPQHLEDEDWPRTHGAALVKRLEELEPDVREAARGLSLVEGSVSLPYCRALTGLDPAQLFSCLDALSRAGVLEGASGGYHFSHPALRDALAQELDGETRRQAHRRLAEVMLAEANPSALTRLVAAVHGMRGQPNGTGPASRYGALVVAAGLELVTKRQEELREAVPHLEVALALFTEARRPERERLVLITALALAGYYAERSLTDKYADTALELQQRVLGLGIARRFRPLLGARLALYLALMWAAVGFALHRRNPRTPGFMETVRFLLNTAAITAGVAALCLDPKRALAYAKILEPLSALGKNHAATVSYRLAVLVATTPTDRLAHVHAEWESLLTRLRDPKPIRALTEELRTYLLAGAQYGKGILECYRDGPQALQTADALEGLGYKIYKMSADQLRTIYYAHQGDLAKSESFRKKVEMHAIVRGTAWQVEAWLPGPMMALYLRTRDAASMKRQVQQLERLVRKLPSMETYLTRSLGAYHLLSGRYQEALPLLEKGVQEPTRELIGWVRGHGALASALNALGDHARAHDVCVYALSQMDEGDLNFCGTNLGVVLELARAEAGLGRVDEALRRIDDCIARFEPLAGPITLGSLHEVRLELSQAEGDSEGATAHRRAMQDWYGRTDVPSLLRRASAEQPEFAANDPGAALHGLSLHDTVESLEHRLTHGGVSSAESMSQWVLSQLAEAAGVTVGYLLQPGAEGLEQVASLDGSFVPAELRTWAEERACAFDDTADTTDLVMDQEQRDQDRCTLDDMAFRFRALTVPTPDGPRLVAVLIAEDSRLVHPALSEAVLDAAARRLEQAAKDAGESEGMTASA